MSKLKKYNEFLYEEAEGEAATAEVNVDNISKLFLDLKNVVKTKIEENKKLIIGYYNKTTRDGQDINTTDEYFTYGQYIGNEKVDNFTMTFKIKFNEPTESGLTFNVIGSVDKPELKNIKATEVKITKKGGAEFKPGFINGKYVVKDQSKIDLIKPKEEKTAEDKKEPVKTPEEQKTTAPSGQTVTSTPNNIKEFTVPLIDYIINEDNWKLSDYKGNIDKIIKNINASIKLINQKVKETKVEKNKNLLLGDKKLLDEVISKINEVKNKMNTKK